MDEINEIVIPLEEAEDIPEQQPVEAVTWPDDDTAVNETAEPDEPDEPDVLSELADRISEQSSQIAKLTELIEKLSSQVAAGNKAIAVHEEIERNLNNELQRYKNDFYDKLATPFLMQFIGLYIDLSEEMAEIKEEHDAAPEKEYLKTQLDSLGYYADSVKGALINNGVEIKTPEPGSSYDYREQRISKTIPTDDETLRDCVAEARSDAFIYNGKVLRPAKVVVYKV